MRFLLYSLLAFVVGNLFPQNLSAQYAHRKWSFGTGINFVDYTAPQTGKYFQPQNFDPALNLSVSRYLSGAFSMTADLSLAQGVRFPAYNSAEMQPGLVDMSYLLNFKFNNGAILKENSFFGPYLTLGIGGSYVKSHPDLYVPLGGGMNFRVSQSVSIRAQAVFKRSLNKDFQNFSQSLGIVYHFKTGEDLMHPLMDTLSSGSVFAMMNLIDSDADGVIDNHDVCPQTPGMVNLQGCPSTNELDKASLRNYRKAAVQTAAQPVQIPQAPALAIEKRQRPTPEETNEPGEDLLPKNIALPGSEISPEPKSTHKPLITNNITIPSIFFETGSDKLTEESLKVLDEVASMLHTHPDAQLEVFGHADASGSEKSNLVLSVMRAFNVKYYLVYKHGISQNRIVSNGLGEEDPKADNVTLGGRQKNRRVDFELVL